MRALSYAFAEALVSLRRSGRSAAMSVGTIAVAFLMVGGFLLVSANLRQLVERWASAAEMSIYLSEAIDEPAREALSAELSANPAIAAVEFVTKEQALGRFRTDFPELADVAADQNPFPSSLEVRLRPDPASQAAAEAIAAGVRDRDGVADVRYDRQWLARLLAVARAIRVSGLAVAAVLVLGAAFTVAAVVRLSLIARYDEIDIMQLVGAPFAFIRGPFVAEGTLLGGVGAILSLVALWALFTTLRARVNEAVSGFASIGELRFLGIGEAALLIVAGLMVGALAGLVASRLTR